ncbi:unnamed protein product [Adineta ricciae]|uniref:Uncharacterized protein n=1 Tax=Adineta ricciae TaxID=249248 RepID=A0A815HBL1_ADIRI|nr:unnamed protein product [Adineta ricciae]
MDRLVGQVLGYAIGGLISLSIDAAVQSRKPNLTTPKGSHSLNPPAAMSISQQRAIVTSSSAIAFGNECERLVNIAFQTSQTFPTMMGTYADFIEYLRKELRKRYKGVCFEIIVGGNELFGCSIGEDEYFAEVQHDQYRVLIFSVKQNPSIKSDTHAADIHLSFVWK